MVIDVKIPGPAPVQSPVSYAVGFRVLQFVSIQGIQRVEEIFPPVIFISGEVCLVYIPGVEGLANFQGFLLVKQAQDPVIIDHSKVFFEKNILQMLRIDDASQISILTLIRLGELLEECGIFWKSQEFGIPRSNHFVFFPIVEVFRQVARCEDR